ncbi:hypothetical protein V8G54_027429 [Vigna mungo]|uniref:Uncharacterized protein n=1 Tax=Vigna mungo TaxID=3915 RepID=A0AAQ3N2G0_VIGMU
MLKPTEETTMSFNQPNTQKQKQLFLTTHFRSFTPQYITPHSCPRSVGPTRLSTPTINTTTFSDLISQNKTEPHYTFEFLFSFSLETLSSHGISDILLRRRARRGSFLCRRLRSRSVAGTRTRTRRRSCRIRFQLHGRDWSVGCSFNARHLQALN